MPMHWYRIAGLAVRSAIALPGVRPADAAEPPDIDIDLGEVPSRLDRVLYAAKTWEANDELFLLRQPGVGRFLLSDGSRVTVMPDSGVTVQTCAPYILGRVLGVLLHWRGDVVLHASAVEVAGRAALFCGESGAGKSTLAAALCAHGHRLLSDDICALRFDSENRPFASADGRGLKVSQAALAALDLQSSTGEPVGNDPEKFHVALSQDLPGQTYPLGYIYILQADPLADAPRIEAFAPSQALIAVQQNSFRPYIVERTGQATRYLRAGATIAQMGRVFRLSRPRDLTRLSEAVVALEEHWRQTATDAFKG